MTNKRIYAVTAILLAAAWTGGCAGGNTVGAEEARESREVLHKTETAAPIEAESGNDRDGSGRTDGSAAQVFDRKADMESIRDTLHMITAHTRASGTEGEQKAAEEIKNRLEQLGCHTALQFFEQQGIGEMGKTVTGINVIAVRKPEKNANTADILYITAHHDAKAGIQGADDDASGVAVLLETARLVGGLPTDTEIRFVTFGGEEDGRVGSRYHVEGLTNDERSRIIGVIQLDELGYWGSDYLKLSTVDGNPVMLGDLLSEKAKHTRNLGREIPYRRDEMSDHNPFHTHGIPAVMLGQDAFAFENHTSQDRTGILDPKRLQQTAQLVADVTAQIMSEETGSLLKRAYEGRIVQTAYEIRPETVIQFDMDRNYVENMMGLSGEPVEESVNEYQDRLETFRYPVIWFGMDEPLKTLFQYRNGYLEMIEIPAQDVLGTDTEEVKRRLEAALGESEAIGQDNGVIYTWPDPLYHKYYSLEPAKDGAWHILVLNDIPGKESRAVYDLSGGIEAAKEEAKEETDKKLLDLVGSILYPEDLPLVRFNVYSDGMNFTTGYTGAFLPDDNTRMDYALDHADAFDKNGEYREYNKTVRTVVHEYGHVLSLNRRQVDITKQDESMPAIMFEKETYGPDAYIRAFYERFWAGLDVKSGLERYHTNPDEFVSAYGASDLSEDFAESFMLFVLSSRPEDDSAASEKIRFFYDYEELVKRRDFIRGNLGLEETSGRMAPDPGAGDYRVVLDGNPTTGYTWLYRMEPEGIVSEKASGFYQNYRERDLVGAGGTFVFDFTGEKEGTARVIFTYSRPWESKQAEQTKVYRMTVDEYGRVTGEELAGQE